jgi:formylglycine-generating enzyme required for sulfatase activity
MIIIHFMRMLFLIFIAQFFILGTGAETANAKEDEYVNSIGMEFVLIPAKTYTMSANDRNKKHQVTISKPFYLGKYEVTQAQWQSVMGSYPNSPAKPDKPVSLISWDDTQEFIKRLNQKEGHDRYRLPTEAEWELAATTGGKWGTSMEFSESDLDKYAWTPSNSGGHSRPVGQKQPNPFGLYDILGNVAEWVYDWYTYDYQNTEKWGSVDPKGTNVKDSNVPGKSVRGGSYSAPERCNSDGRFYWGRKQEWIGFRLAMNVQ